jgi:hypothetical protein
MEGGGHRPACVAGRRHKHGQWAMFDLRHARQVFGQEAGADILERGGGAMKQLQHRRSARKILQRDREIERGLADFLQLRRQQVAGKKRLKQPRSNLLQGLAAGEGCADRLGQSLRDKESAVRSDANLDGVA